NLGLQRLGVAVLRGLDEEHQPERHDGGRGVDPELVIFGPTVVRAQQSPDNHQNNRASDSDWMTSGARNPVSELRKGHTVRRVWARRCCSEADCITICFGASRGECDVDAPGAGLKL